MSDWNTKKLQDGMLRYKDCESLPIAPRVVDGEEILTRDNIENFRKQLHGPSSENGYPCLYDNLKQELAKLKK